MVAGMKPKPKPARSSRAAQPRSPAPTSLSEATDTINRAAARVAAQLGKVPRERVIPVLVGVCALLGMFSEARRLLDAAEAAHRGRRLVGMRPG